MKLLFVYDMLPEHDLHWRDGLWAALHELEKEWEVEYLNIAVNKDWKDTILHRQVDFVLGWGNSSSPFFYQLRIVSVGGQGGWCFGGGDINDPQLEIFPVVFVENQSHLIKPNFKLAFGTNTNVFFPRPLPKLIDALYPAAFARWKHQEIFAEICKNENLKGLAVGYIQRNNPDESMEIIKECLDRGVGVLDWIPAESLALLYNMSKEVIITADPQGGCERTVLEAKASGVPVKLVTSSQKLLDLGKLIPQEVREYWNHIKYAEALKKGINEVLSNGR